MVAALLTGAAHNHCDADIRLNQKSVFSESFASVTNLQKFM